MSHSAKVPTVFELVTGLRRRLNESLEVLGRIERQLGFSAIKAEAASVAPAPTAERPVVKPKPPSQKSTKKAGKKKGTPHSPLKQLLDKQSKPTKKQPEGAPATVVVPGRGLKS